MNFTIYLGFQRDPDIKQLDDILSSANLTQYAQRCSRRHGRKLNLFISQEDETEASFGKPFMKTLVGL